LHICISYIFAFDVSEYLSRFTPIGRRFLNCTTKCLLQNQKASCADIKKSAFESHTNCYVKCDFCRVCKSDKWNLIGSYDYSDFFSWTAIKQVQFCFVSFVSTIRNGDIIYDAALASNLIFSRSLYQA
uniref:ShKT domain-containing protein n=1 Tax=Toxocara canis TaxID=6265 RepID=A0A183U544_TOXCA